MNADNLIKLARVKLYAARIGCPDAVEIVGGLLGSADDALLRVAVYANNLGCVDIVDAIAAKISTPQSEDERIHAAIAEYCKTNMGTKIPIIKVIRGLGIPAVEGLFDAKQWVERNYHEEWSYKYNCYVMVRN